MLLWVIQMATGKVETGLSMCWVEQGGLVRCRRLVHDGGSFETFERSQLSLDQSSNIVLGVCLTFLMIIDT